MTVNRGLESSFKQLSVCLFSSPPPLCFCIKWVCLQVSTRHALLDRQLHSLLYLPGETWERTRCCGLVLHFADDEHRSRLVLDDLARTCKLPAHTPLSCLSVVLFNTAYIQRSYSISACCFSACSANTCLCVGHFTQQFRQV